MTPKAGHRGEKEGVIGSKVFGWSVLASSKGLRVQKKLVTHSQRGGGLGTKGPFHGKETPVEFGE